MRKKRAKTIFPVSILVGFLCSIVILFFISNKLENALDNNTIVKPIDLVNRMVKPTLTPTPSEIPIPLTYVIPLKTHVFQSYNNCGPAALSMALSYYGIEKTQQELGYQLRPFQVPGGDNDDKSVTLEELAEKSREFGIIPYHRPNGNLTLLKKFVANNIPVITRTWLTPNDDIGHYRLVRGYNESQILQDDSLQDKNIWYSESDFNTIWNKFNYEYLVLIPENQKTLAEAILGENVDYKTAWSNAVALSQNELSQNPDDIYARFNLSVAYYNIGEYQKSVEEFEKVEKQLPFRTLWYQIEPIEAYYELKNYDRVYEITDRILNYHNRSFSELYLLRGNSYLAHNNIEAARGEFEKAVRFNIFWKPAKLALDSL